MPMPATKSANLRRLGLCAAIIFLGIGPNQTYANKAPWVGLSLDGEACQGRMMEYGPFDYTNIIDKTKKLSIVEQYHYTKDIQLLLQGNTGYLKDDLDYTVTAFPNHHKALASIMNYQLIYKKDIDEKKKLPLASPVECYFQRAIHFTPKDPTLYILYGHYLKRIKHPEDAENVYKKALIATPEDLRVKYSYGLFLFDNKRYPEAMEQARRLYAQKFPNQKLKELLVKSGHWQE